MYTTLLEACYGLSQILVRAGATCCVVYTMILLLCQGRIVAVVNFVYMKLVVL
jgi:hypothetical protein